MRRRVAAATLIGLVTTMSWAVPQTVPASGETIVVQRLIVDARVTNDDGSPVKGLTRKNFEVRVDGKRAVVETVEWIPEQSSDTEPADARGRQIVLFFQRDINAVRTNGHARIIRHVETLLDSFTADDRVAVVQFDVRLRLLQDFTSDRKLIRAAIERSIFAHGKAVVSELPTSFASFIMDPQSNRAHSAEEGLRVVAEALGDTPGVKSLLLFGWGFGRYNRQTGVELGRDYEQARRALDRARVSVFSLDVSDADYHSLEDAMQGASSQTGGAYVKTNVFPVVAMNTVLRSMRGRYEIVVIVPPLRGGEHDVKVKLRGARGRLLTRGAYISD